VQVFLNQVPPGSTTVGAPIVLTALPNALDADYNIFALLELFNIGATARGTGTGQSRAYVGFTNNTVRGLFSDVLSSEMNNHIIRLDYP